MRYGFVALRFARDGLSCSTSIPRPLHSDILTRWCISSIGRWTRLIARSLILPFGGG